MSNLDNRISNADQLLTNDIDKFCESVTDFYSNASKPVLDIIIYMYRLTANIGAKVFMNPFRKIFLLNLQDDGIENIHFDSIFLSVHPDALDSYVVSLCLRSPFDAFEKANR